MFKKRRFKPVNKKMVSLGLAVIMLMSVPGKSILSYAMTGQEQNAQKQNVQEQSVESESGYRLYADELTSDSGAVKGDITEVLPEYEIINVKLPDGSLAAPEEVNFPVTESGEYVFEVIYDSVPDDIEPSQTQETGSEEVRSVGAQSAGEQSAEAQIPEQGTEEQSDSGSLQDSEKNIESEELTLTVTLPEAETEKAAQPVQEETLGGESEPQEAVAASSTAAFARSAANSISTRAGVFGDDNGWSTSNKTWALSDFPDAYVYGYNEHINYAKNLICQMETYDLYRLDRMTLGEFSELLGDFADPCPGAQLTSGFGWREFRNSFHKGIDHGTGNDNIPVYAAVAGTVTTAGWSDSAGYWIVIDHGDGLVTKYMHHKELYVEEGDEVEKGQQIGLSGSTGDSTGNHLHFQLEINGAAVDPLPYLYPEAGEPESED